MSTPGQGSILGSFIIFGKVDFGPSFGEVYRPLNNQRIVTASGSVTILPFDQLIVLKKTVPATTTVILPSVTTWLQQPYGGFPLIIKDGNGDSSSFNITLTPNGTNKINGLSSYTIAGDGAMIYLVPLIDRSGWATL